MLVVGQEDLASRLECGSPIRQTLRGSPSNRTSHSWLDAVQYEIQELAADVERGLVELSNGETRAIVRYKAQDDVVFFNFLEVPAVPAWDLTERLRTLVSWDIQGSGGGGCGSPPDQGATSQWRAIRPGRCIPQRISSQAPSAVATNRGWDTNAILGHVDPHSVTESACAGSHTQDVTTNLCGWYFLSSGV